MTAAILFTQNNLPACIMASNAFTWGGAASSCLCDFLGSRDEDGLELVVLGVFGVSFFSFATKATRP